MRQNIRCDGGNDAETHGSAEAFAGLLGELDNITDIVQHFSGAIQHPPRPRP